MKSLILLAFLLVANFAWGGEVNTDVYFFANPGSVWIYHDNQSVFQRRTITALKDVQVSNLGKVPVKLQFVELTALTGNRPDISKSSDGERDTLYYLKTAHGILRSPRLGEEAKEFWPGAFLFLPRQLSPKAEWDGFAQGARLHLRFEGMVNVQVPAGKFSDCLHITYQHGFESDGKGEMDYCPGVGEVLLREGDYRRELLRFIPGKSVTVASLDEASSAIALQLLTQEQEVIPLIEQGTEKANAKNGNGFKFFWFLSAGLLLTAFFGLILIVRLRRLQSPPVLFADLKEELQKMALAQSPGEQREALQRLQDLAKAYPQYADVHFQLGIMQEKCAELPDAITSFKRAIEINPRYVEPHHRLGLLYQQQKKLIDAVHHLQQVLQLRPGFADVHNCLGEMLRELGEVDKAREHFAQALSINPHFANARSNLQTGKR